MPLSTWSQAWLDFAIQFAATGIGVLLALWFEHAREKRQDDKADNERSRERKEREKARRLEAEARRDELKELEARLAEEVARNIQAIDKVRMTPGVVARAAAALELSSELWTASQVRFADLGGRPAALAGLALHHHTVRRLRALCDLGARASQMGDIQVEIGTLVFNARSGASDLVKALGGTPP